MSTNTTQGNTNGSSQPEGENDWFFDIIINFLRSPRWKTPIMSYLDEHCIIFDNDDENKLEYTQIHNVYRTTVHQNIQDFKKIVDDLLCELMAELDITQEQFLEACEKASSNPTHKKIVDQIMAVDSFIAFKKLMIKRNTELNEEALKMMLLKEQQQLQQQMLPGQQLEQQNQQRTQQPGVTVNTNGSKTHTGFDPAEAQYEQEEINLALQMSMAAEEERKQQEEEEQELLKMVMEASIKEEQARIEKQKSLHEEQEKIIQKVEKESVVEHRVEQQKKIEVVQEEIKQMPVEEVKVSKQAKEPKKAGYDLPPVALRKGGMGFDPQLLKDQQDAILRGLSSMDEELSNFDNKKNTDPFENKSLSEVLKEKREATEKILENTKVNQQESIEERKQRLRAHRDQLLKQKNEQRQKELNSFNDKATNKEDLFKELKELDAKTKAKEHIQKLEENFDMDSLEGSEVDKRLAMYRNLRNQLMQDLSNSKELDHQAKMDELNKKIEALEKSKKEKLEREELQRQAQEQQRMQKNKGFLDGIKSYNIEDI